MDFDFYLNRGGSAGFVFGGTEKKKEKESAGVEMTGGTRCGVRCRVVWLWASVVLQVCRAQHDQYRYSHDSAGPGRYRRVQPAICQSIMDDLANTA